MEVVARDLSFGTAFNMINEIKPIKLKEIGMRLPQWSPEVVVRVQRADEHSKMTAPYLYVESRYGKVPWKETMIELFSNEWQLVILEV